MWDITAVVRTEVNSIVHYIDVCELSSLTRREQQRRKFVSSFYFLITYGVCKKRKYSNRMSEKKNSLLLTNVYDFYVLEDKTSKKNIRLSVCLSVWMYVRTWTFHADTITFEGVSGSKQNLVGVFHVWNVGLVLKSKVISWCWSWSWFWTEFWSSQKLCGATPNLVDIFSTWRMTFSNEFHSEILILHVILILILKKKKFRTKFAEQNKISWVSLTYKT